jgi:anti-sigma factor RsiW
MKWQCALLQRWLPEYPDGDLPAWAKRWLRSHLAHCAACRQEVAELREVVTALEAKPVADPGPEFWHEFSREMHLKLVQAAPAPARPRWFRLPYLLGAPAVAVLLVWVAVHLTGPGIPLGNQTTARRPEPGKLAEVARKSPAPPPAVSRVAAVPQRAPVAPELAAPAALGMEQIVTVALEGGVVPPVEEVDISGWDLDAELAGMTAQEKEIFLHKLHQRNKDGSCLERFSSCSWS